MSLVTTGIEFLPGDKIFTTDIMSDDLSERGAYATVSKVHKDTLFVHYGIYTDFCEVEKNSCVLVKRPKDPIILMPNDVGFF